MDTGTPAVPPATVPAAASPPDAPKKPADHPEIVDGRFHTLGRKTLWIFVLQRIHPSIILLLLAMGAFAAQGDPAVVKLLGPRFAPYASEIAWWTLAAFLVVFGLTYFFSWLTYVNYKFLIGEDSLRISRGILAKEEIAIPYRQIQDVDIERSLYYRMMGLSKLVILTAGREDEKGGGNESEGILPAMDRNLAEWMQQELLRRTEVQRVVEVNPAEAG